MDGYTLGQDVRHLMMEDSSSVYIDDGATYLFLWEAAIQLNNDLKLLSGTGTITTVASQSAYTLPADFQELYATDTFNRLFVKATNSSADYYVYWKDYQAILSENFNRSSFTQEIPDNFSIRDDTTPTRLTGSATSTSSIDSYGESHLINSAAPFANVNVGDIVHNITDSSHGYVTEVVSTSSLHIAILFYNSSSNKFFTSGDSYVISPQGRMQMYVTPIPSTTGITISYDYIKRPDPVLSAYRAYPFPAAYRFLLVKYAAWLYKYRDKEPNYGDAWFKYYEQEIRRLNRTMKRQRVKSSFRVNYNKHSLVDRTWR